LRVVLQREVYRDLDALRIMAMIVCATTGAI
jgi:hypothetical protein